MLRQLHIHLPLSLDKKSFNRVSFLVTQIFEFFVIMGKFLVSFLDYYYFFRYLKSKITRSMHFEYFAQLFTILASCRCVSCSADQIYEDPTRFKQLLNDIYIIIKVQRADLTCDVIRKVAPFVLSKL